VDLSEGHSSIILLRPKHANLLRNHAFHVGGNMAARISVEITMLADVAYVVALAPDFSRSGASVLR
jgi:hypothetical protein